MKKLLVVAVVSLLAAVGAAHAADLPRRPVPQQVWNWTGLYLGAHIGAGWGQSNFDDGEGPVLYGSDVRTPAIRGGGQFGYNWQMPASSWVVGAEAEFSALGADGSGTCFATSSFIVSANCRVRQEAMAIVTGRIGYAVGPSGRTLVYVKGGGAWLREHISFSTHDQILSTRHDRFGWIVGAGLEQAITPAWSFKLDYDYADFGKMAVAAPATRELVLPNYVPLLGGPAQVSQTMQSIKLGLNLKLGADAGARWDAVPASPLGVPVKAMAAQLPAGTEIEIGGRIWYSFGRFQKDLGAMWSPLIQDPLSSRLTYTSETASGEVFGRIDTASNVVIKGIVGGGALSRGKMRDEDWLINDGWVPYSNTLSDPVHGSITYVTGDLGYDIVRDGAAKFSAFIGYNYLRDDKTAMGCVQLAGGNPFSTCLTPIPSTTAGISEKNDWHSLRIGINGVMALTERLQLTADAAYLPYVRFYGVDNHMQRVTPLLSPEFGTGQGAQLEAILSYTITPSFSVGAGGRYWAMWATGTDAYTNFSGSGSYKSVPVRNERFGGFLQASYTFDSAR